MGFQTHPNINLARLKVSPPEVVYAELQEEGKKSWERRYPTLTDELQLALFERNDPLINLGLAEHSSSPDIVQRLYKRARKGTGDGQYDKGVRLACLSNSVIKGLRFFEKPLAVDDKELVRLALTGDSDELRCLMQNPTTGALLEAVYTRETPFDEISIDRLYLLVHASVGSPRLNFADDTEDGPDLHRGRIRRAIFKLLQSVPVTAYWAEILHQLIGGLDSAGGASADEIAAELERWTQLKIPKQVVEGVVEKEGRYTSLSLVDEFRCLIAASYGNGLVTEGTASDATPAGADVALRCAYYGNAKYTPEKMKADYERDKDVFTFAACFNNINILLNPKCRTLLEEGIYGPMLKQLYTTHCDGFAQLHKWFNPEPVTDRLKPSETDELKSTLTALKTGIAKVEKDLLESNKFTIIGLVVLFLYMVFFKH